MAEDEKRPEAAEGLSASSMLLLPFADPPSIVQAHQKDDQIESMLSRKVEEVIKSLKGQLYVNECPQEISIAVKVLYLSLTTLIGNRTLGEEKILFIISYTLGPYLAARLLKKWNKETTTDGDEEEKYPWKNVSNTLLNIHLIVFYFKGSYYDISKRVYGMRYAIGHRVKNEEAKFRKSSSHRYKILGYFLLLQGIFKGVPPVLRQLRYITGLTGNSLKGIADGDEKGKMSGEIEGVPKDIELVHVDLEDSSQLPFIPSASRRCILCLNEMVDPSCAPCGHLFCWACLMNWCKEKEECPLCRQMCLRQQILPLR